MNDEDDGGGGNDNDVDNNNIINSSKQKHFRMLHVFIVDAGNIESRKQTWK